MKVLVFLVSLLAGFSLFAQEPVKSTSVTYERQLRAPKKYKKNILQLELLGRGIFYGIGYERMLNQEIGIGASLSYTKFNWQPFFIETEVQVITVPLYMNYYMNPGRHNFVLTGGLTAWHISATSRVSDSLTTALEEQYNQNGETNPYAFDEIEFTASGTFAVPQAGMGYEFRGSSGFITRANLYAFYIGRILPFFGLSVGVAF